MKRRIGLQMLLSFLITASGAVSQADDPASVSSLHTYTIKAPVIEQVSQFEVQATGGATVTSEDTLVTAQQVKADTRTQLLTAKGNVLVSQNGSVLTAQEVVGNLQTGQWTISGAMNIIRQQDMFQATGADYNSLTLRGSLNNAHGQYGIYYVRGDEVILAPGKVITVRGARASTCNAEHQHWAVGSKTIEIHGQTFGVARGMGVWIGNTKVFAFPRYRFDLQQGPESNLLPTPGFDQRDGAYLRYRYPFSTHWTTSAGLWGRFTQRNGVQSNIEVQRSLHAMPVDQHGAPSSLYPDVPADLMGVSLVSNKQRQAALEGSNREYEGYSYDALMLTHVFLRASWKDRIYDPDSRYLYVDRVPELGVRLHDIPLRWPSIRNPLRIAAQTSVGDFRERSNDEWNARADVRATARLTSSIGRRVLLEPAFLARYATYSSGKHQQVLGASLAAGRELTPQYFAAITYIRHWTSGQSPFEFDDVDVKDKLATRINADWGQMRGSLTMDYDLQTGGIYDWGLKLAKVFHCIEPRISYQNRYRDLTIGVAFVMPH